MPLVQEASTAAVVRSLVAAKEHGVLALNVPAMALAQVMWDAAAAPADIDRRLVVPEVAYRGHRTCSRRSYRDLNRRNRGNA